MIGIDYDILFKLFVDSDGFRENLKTPLRQRGYYYATDAHSLIRLSASITQLDFVERDSPNCEAVFPTQRNGDFKIDINLLEKEFNSKVQIPPTEKCSKCEGEGILECDLGHEHECDKCDGTGVKDYREQLQTVRIHAIDFKIYQIERLIKACKIIGVNQIVRIYGEMNRANVFVAGDFEILIMATFQNEKESSIVLNCAVAGI